MVLFAIATAALLGGFVFGPRVPHRGLFEVPTDPVFAADRRAKKFLPAANHSVFFFVGGRDENHPANVLSLEIFRELLRRRDHLMADERITPYFKERPNPLAGHPTSGPWGIPEAVRDIMNSNNPLLPWPGPDFARTTPEQFNTLLTFLFNIHYELAQSAMVYPYRQFFTLDLAQDSTGTWHAKGMVMPISADRGRLEAATRAGKLDNLDQWELWVDSYWQPPFPETVREPVRVWSFAGINAQIDAEVQATLPLVGLAFVVMCLLVVLFLRNWRDVLVVSLSLFLLMGWLAGTQAWLGYPATQLSSMLPILILALAVDFSIHSLHRWRLLRVAHPLWNTNPRQAGLATAGSTIAGFIPSLGLATLTTIIAFGSALFSPIPDLKEWGVLAIGAIVFSYLLLGVFAVYLRSGLVSTSRKRPSLEAHPLRTPLRVLAGRLDRTGLGVVALFAVVTVALLMVGGPSADFNVRDYVSHNSRFVESLKREQTLWPASGEPSYMLIEGSQLATPEIMKKILYVIESLPALGASLEGSLQKPSIIDVMRLQESLLTESSGGDDRLVKADRDGLPDTTAGMVSILKNIRDHGTRDTLDPHHARLVITPDEAAELYQLQGNRLVRLRIWFKVARPEDWAMMRKLLDKLKWTTRSLRQTEGINVFITGLSYTRYAYVNDLTASFSSSTLAAIFLCGLVVLLAFRDLRLSILTIVPVLVVAVWLRALMKLTGMSMNIVTVQVISLAIGLGIDYPIHLTQRLREARRQNPHQTRVEWMSGTMEETGLALIGSAGTTLAGFLLLLLSAMPLFSMFGRIMSLMIVLALLGALLLLPCLLLKWGGLASRGDRNA